MISDRYVFGDGQFYGKWNAFGWFCWLLYSSIMYMEPLAKRQPIFYLF
jgi:hypothetical protein